MKPIGKRLNCEGRVAVVGNGNDNRVEQTAFIHVCGVVKHLNARKMLLCIGSSRLCNIANCSKLHAGHLALCDMYCVAGSHVTKTNNTNSYLIHGF